MATVRVGKSVEKLSRASQVAAQLEEATNEMDRVFQRFEKLFVELRLFVPVTIEIGVSTTSRGPILLKWKKVDAIWGFYIVHHQEIGKTVDGKKILEPRSPVSEERFFTTERQNKILAASNIDALIDQLFDEVVRIGDDTNQALKTAQRAFAGLHCQKVGDE